MKVHCGAVGGTRAPSPRGQGQNTQPRVFSSSWVGVNHLPAGGASPAPLSARPPPPVRVSARPRILSSVLLDPLYSGFRVRAALVLPWLECCRAPH